ncbi:hypothetical protein SapgrDRAFT_2747, partial [Saprospira grandis DSM 2844]
MKALAIFLFHSFLFISPFNAIKMDNHQLFLVKQQQYQEDTALYEETLAQYLELHSLYQELPAEDPDRPSLKAALLKTKEGLKAFKPQLKMDKANLEQLFLALKEEEIPKEQYRKLLADFFKNASEVLKSRIGKSPKLESTPLSIFQAQLAQFFKQIPGPLSKQLNKEIKAIPIDINNVEDFLAAFLAILEKYSQEDQIKANWFNTFSIKEENLLKKISYQQLESILDQALAIDDFLTEEELIEQQEKDLLLLEEKLAGVISYIKMKINNEYDLLPAAEEYFKYKIKSTSCISNLTAARQGIHPKLHSYLFQNWAAAIQAEQEYDPQLLKKILLDNTKLPKDFAENWFKEDMAIAKINEQELLANNWSTGCFVKEQLLLEIKDEEAKK